MTIDFAFTESVRQLRKAGLRPSEKLVGSIFKAGAAARPALLELATDVNLLHEEPPVCYAPIHALRLLGELPGVEMIDPLIREIPIELAYEDEKLPQMWGEEMPQMIARIGVEAAAPLWALVDDSERSVAHRTIGLIALGYLATTAPETRDEVAAGLRERLATAEDPTLVAYLLIAMADVGMSDMYPEAMRLFRAGKVDQRYLPPGVARQLLLTNGPKRSACALHSLWERYDQHGPREDGENEQ
ncbi:MAG TPA: hypothetical protein VFS21_16095 [Roseiflexaceae bacterium]|nr:hypothetical protein [Roseiflexaceae bacterium]